MRHFHLNVFRLGVLGECRVRNARRYDPDLAGRRRPMDTPFFYGQESKEAVAYHSSAADLSKFSKTGLTDIEDIVPLIKFLVSEGWWITGQTILANGGYTTK